MNTNVITAVVAVVLAATGAAYAEGGCPPGMIPYQGTNTQSCGPIPSSGGQTTPTGPKWASRWGAIAQDATTGIVGAVADRESKRQAKKDAIAECKSRGGSNCKLELEYTNQCVAIIQGSTASNFPHAASPEQAIALGMDACKKRGDTHCHVYYKACSLPVQVR